MEVRSAPEFGTWLEEHYASAYKTAYMILGNRHDSEEAVQEAFLRVWRFRDSLAGVTSVKPWIYRVVVNACLSKVKSETNHRPAMEPTDFDALASPDGDPGDSVYRNELAAAISQAVGSLSEELRTAFVLKYYSGLSEKEISVAIRRRPGTVKSRLYEARKKLSAHPALKSLASEWLPVGTGGSEGETDDVVGR